MLNISDDKLYFDPSWYSEQISNSPQGGNNMDDHKEKKGSGDIMSDPDIAEDKGIAPCRCCEETECRLPANEWTDD